MAELLDLGFKEAPNNATVKKPAPAQLDGVADMIAEAEMEEGGAGKTLRVVGAVQTSPRPKSRPSVAAPPEEMLVAMQDGIAGALAEATAAAPAPVAAQNDQAVAVALAETVGVSETAPAADNVAVSSAPASDPPQTAAEAVALADATLADALAEAAQDPDAAVAPPTEIVNLVSSPAPKPRPEEMFADAEPATQLAAAEPEVVTRISTSGGRHWGINVGRFNTRSGAERQLLKTALAETATLNDGLRKVVERSGGYDANFVGLTQDQADLACRRLQARAVQCFTMGP